MTDEEYVRRQTERERRLESGGARYRKGKRGGNGCTLPSDYLSKKELQKMNGEPYSVSLRKYIPWEEFKQLPDDLIVIYLNDIIEEYGVGATTISKVLFGKCASALGMYLKSRNIADRVAKTKNVGMGAKKYSVKFEKRVQAWKEAYLANGGERSECELKKPVSLESRKDDVPSESADTVHTESVSNAPNMFCSISSMNIVMNGFDMNTILALANTFAGRDVKVQLTVEAC